MAKYETGGRVAGPAFAKFVEGYVRLYPQTKRKFIPPEGVTQRSIKGRREYFTKTSPLPKTNSLEENEAGGMLF